MQHATLRNKLVTSWTTLLLLVTLAGGAAMILRFFTGLGAVTNMSDDLPWGLWKAFNVIVVIALGAGGFTSAALIYIFYGEKYHGFARSGVLFALCCYASAGFSLVFDIGIPWRIVYPIFIWPEHHSLLFEVAWCVMFYQSVLFLELVPAVWERFGRHEVAVIWRKLVPVYTVLGLTLFTYMMTHGMPGDLAWTGATFVFFGLAAIILPRIVHHAATTPILLVMFGIVLSTCHQSTLGSLFLLMPDKLSHLWWTPMLPVNFILSAIAIGLCMVIVERTLSALAFGRVIEREKLAGLAKLAGPLLWLYLVVRLVDMAARGNLGLISGGKGIIFIMEMIPALIAGLMLINAKVRKNTGPLIVACVLAVVGVVLNRMNVCIWGMNIPGAATYVPTFIEVLISTSVVTGILLVYTLVVKLFPVYTAEHADADHGKVVPVPA